MCQETSPQVNSPQEHLVSAVGCVTDSVRTRSMGLVNRFFLTRFHHCSRLLSLTLAASRYRNSDILSPGQSCAAQTSSYSSTTLMGSKETSLYLWALFVRYFSKTLGSHTMFAVDLLMIHTQNTYSSRILHEADLYKQLSPKTVVYMPLGNML